MSLDPDLIVMAKFLDGTEDFERYREIAPVVVVDTVPAAIGTLAGAAALLGLEALTRALEAYDP